jgi:hypothetical protein
MPQAVASSGPSSAGISAPSPLSWGEAGGQADGIEPLTLRFSAGYGSSVFVPHGSRELHSPC